MQQSIQERISVCYRDHLKRCKGNKEKIKYIEYYKRFVHGKPKEVVDLSEENLEKEAKAWMFTTKYKCKVCSKFESNHRSTIKDHLKRRHGKSMDDDLVEVTPPLLTRCQMCQKIAKRDSKFMVESSSTSLFCKHRED